MDEVIKRVEMLVEREVEKTWREGWAAGYNAGLREDAASGTYWCDEGRDWRESDTRKSLDRIKDQSHG